MRFQRITLATQAPTPGNHIPTALIILLQSPSSRQTNQPVNRLSGRPKEKKSSRIDHSPTAIGIFLRLLHGVVYHPPDLAFRQDSRGSLLAADPAIARAPYQQTYDHASPLAGDFEFRGGMSSAHVLSSRRSKMDFISSKWPRLFFATIGIQAIICLAFES